MKKLSYITVLGLAAGLAFATNALAKNESNTLPYGIYSANEGVGGWYLDDNNHSLFKAIADGGASLIITKVENTTGRNITFGYYVGSFDSSSYTTENLPETKITLNDDSTATSLWTQSFNKDALVGFWVLDNGVYHDLGINGQGGAESPHNDGSGIAWAEYSGMGNNENQSKFKIYLAGGAPASTGGDVTPASGGPLPGVWATIALAGAASAYLKRRRKENK